MNQLNLLGIKGITHKKRGNTKQKRGKTKKKNFLVALLAKSISFFDKIRLFLLGNFRCLLMCF
jgi:hypothetical protein